MKKRIYMLLFLVVSLVPLTSLAINHTITVEGNYPDFTFNPNSLSVNVGDSITWVQDFISYPLASTLVPEGAAPFAYSGFGSYYTYVIQNPGAYTFESPLYHFQGQIIALPETGVVQSNETPAVVKVYPSVTNDELKLSVREAFVSSKPLSAEVYDAMGNKVLNFDFISDTPMLIHVGGLANGIYFVTVTDNQSVIAVQRIVKQ